MKKPDKNKEATKLWKDKKKKCFDNNYLPLSELISELQRLLLNVKTATHLF